MTPHFDVAVIGAGVGGSLAASLLAHSGLRTAIFERDSESQHKVCGEFLSSEGVSLLLQSGFDLFKELSVSPTVIKMVCVHSGTHHFLRTLPASGAGISRKVLDARLLSWAQSFGAQIFRGTTIRNWHRSNAGWSVGDITATHLIFAIGKHDLPFTQMRSGERKWVGVKLHLESPRNFDLPSITDIPIGQTVHLFQNLGAYGGLSPIDNGQFNLCFLTSPQQIARTGIQSAKVLEAMLQTTRGPLREILSQLKPAWPRALTTSLMPYGFVRETALGDKIYSIGDQAAVIPSLTGDGMSIAISSARACAQAIIEGVSAEKFQKDLAQRLQKQMFPAIWTQRILASPKASRTSLHLLRLFPKLADKIYERTRVHES